jgi:8-oxo-dGTP pyrophosphatase MutT (NUDIX family)
MAKKNKTSPQIQYAALPYRPGCDGAVEILLVTSRDTRRWVVPKGWPMRGCKGHQTAAREAFEEAGLLGKTEKRSIGAYPYAKRLPDGSAVPCSVQLFPLRVKKQRDRWPEDDERERRWFALADAARAVDEPELASLIQAFTARGAPPVIVAE